MSNSSSNNNSKHLNRISVYEARSWCFTYMNSFNTHNNSTIQVFFLFDEETKSPRGSINI